MTDSDKPTQDGDETTVAGGTTVPGGWTPPSRGSPAVGDRIDAFRLVRKLGEGGMGVVFQAEQDAPIRRTVALKLMKPGMNWGRVLARFEAERQALAIMSHPHIARIYDAGTTEQGHPFFVMEYVPGVPLTEYCDSECLSLRRRLELFVDVCRGVQHAHQKGIIHRDLKPTNILVQETDGKPEVKIIDFGIARAIQTQPSESAAMTEVGQVVGTLAYMSPEQATLDDTDIDTRTDVYALGVVLYEMLVGSLLFDPRDMRKLGFEETLRRIREETPPRPSQRVTASRDGKTSWVRRTTPVALSRLLSGDLDWITMRALEKDRSRRYDSAADLARDIGHYLRDEPVSAGPPSWSYRTRKFVRRHRIAVLFSAAIVTTVIVGAVLAGVGFVRATRAESQARYEADTSSEVIDFLVGLFRISDPGEARGNAVTAREILDRGVASIEAELADRPDVQGRMLETMGLVYRSLGLYRESQPLLEAAVADYRKAYGAQSAEVADGLNALGGLLLLQRRGSDALPVLEAALAIQNEALAPDDLRRARTWNNLGLAMRLTDRMEDALAYYRKGLSIRQNALGADHVELIRPLSNIASLQRAMGDSESALTNYGRALAIAEKQLPADHPDLARVLNNLATLKRREARYEEARVLLERVLSIREQTLGPDHPDLVTTLVNLGELHAALGNDRPAIQALERALTVGAAKFPADQPLMVQARERLDHLRAGLGTP